MLDKEAVIHDINVIVHLADRIDTDDKEQVRAILLLQKKDHLFRSEYGQRFIARLIAIFTDRKTPQTDIFTGAPLNGSFPVTQATLDEMRKDPEHFATLLENNEERQDKAAASPEKTEERPKATAYQLEELRFRQREEEIEIENRRAMQEKAELDEAQRRLDREEAAYQAVRDTAQKAVDTAKDTAEEISNRVYEFSKAENGDGNNIRDLFADIEKPWKYWKIYAVVFLMFLLFGYWFIMTKSAGAMVPEMILGAGFIPAVLVLFIDEICEIYEGNTSPATGILIFGIGMIISLLLTFLNGVMFRDAAVLNVIFSSVLDEALLFLTMFALIMRHIRNTGHNATVLQGLWYGAWLGFGFAFYQICQTSLGGYLGDNRPGVFMWRILSQSVLSIGGHVAWTCICGGALSVIVTETGVIKSAEFSKMCSLAVLYPVIMQMLWDMPFLNAGLFGCSLKNILLMIPSAAVLNIFLHRGIREAISAHQGSSHMTEETPA